MATPPRPGFPAPRLSPYHAQLLAAVLDDSTAPTLARAPVGGSSPSRDEHNRWSDAESSAASDASVRLYRGFELAEVVADPSLDHSQTYELLHVSSSHELAYVVRKIDDAGFVDDDECGDGSSRDVDDVLDELVPGWDLEWSAHLEFLGAPGDDAQPPRRGLAFGTLSSISRASSSASSVSSRSSSDNDSTRTIDLLQTDSDAVHPYPLESCVDEPGANASSDDLASSLLPELDASLRIVDGAGTVDAVGLSVRPRAVVVAGLEGFVAAATETGVVHASSLLAAFRSLASTALSAWAACDVIAEAHQIVAEFDSCANAIAAAASLASLVEGHNAAGRDAGDAVALAGTGVAADFVHACALAAAAGIDSVLIADELAGETPRGVRLAPSSLPDAWRAVGTGLLPLPALPSPPPHPVVPSDAGSPLAEAALLDGCLRRRLMCPPKERAALDALITARYVRDDAAVVVSAGGCGELAAVAAPLIARAGGDVAGDLWVFSSTRAALTAVAAVKAAVFSLGVRDVALGVLALASGSVMSVPGEGAWGEPVEAATHIASAALDSGAPAGTVVMAGGSWDAFVAHEPTAARSVRAVAMLGSRFESLFLRHAPHDLATARYVVSPLEVLPHQVAARLLQAIAATSPHAARNLATLVLLFGPASPHLALLDFSLAPAAATPAALTWLASPLGPPADSVRVLRFPNLTALSLAGIRSLKTQVIDKLIAAYAGSTALTALDLSGTGKAVRDSTVALIASSLPRLASLSLADCNSVTCVAPLFVSLPCLARLSLHGLLMVDDMGELPPGWTAASHASMLSLDLSACDAFAPSTLKSVLGAEHMATLTSLALGGCVQLDLGVLGQVAPAMPKLRRLNLAGLGSAPARRASARRAFAAWLEECNSLTALDMSGVTGDAGLAGLEALAAAGGMAPVSTLQLAHTQLSCTLLQTLFATPSMHLAELDLTGCGLERRMVAAMAPGASVPSLRSLAVRSCGLGARSCRMLVRIVVLYYPGLTRLDMAHNPELTDAAFALSPAGGGASGSDDDEDGNGEVEQVLHPHTALTELDLSGCRKLTPEGIDAIDELFPSLCVLGRGGCKSIPPGVVAQWASL
ncbi:uncharacterized protein AMSG_03041 [Thecamonas trahens ATCC 50062]|uniref:Uncharacterized protein n=1 Tax=Thecamonas trahens ATCC 50062 TaxID=461836 RepID=A0A0L0D2S8_THETB|nr:hypothetical protein AMSG_03041 [Thecamonas trahens ATCC 50062]KNC46604.1 hypothetical protein AMSG_03041 [Thecamonas trahens ATCC 50062]|eukprot:XP_013760379.1 hypothetical protein AMSG_03041 [Thecamonas trahens ATCC 50062]